MGSLSTKVSTSLEKIGKLTEVSKIFILDIAGNGYSSVTVKYYRENLRRIAEFIGDKPFSEITRQDISAFYDHLRSTGRSNSTVQVYWKIIRSLYNFIEKEYKLTERPDKDFRMPRFSNVEVTPFTKDEMERMMNACKSRRDKAVILILLDTGLRASELCRVCIKDVDVEAGTINVRPFQTGLKSRGRIVYLGRAAKKVTMMYIASREVRKDDFLIATVDEKMIERYQLKNIVARIATNAGVANAHPHKFRHTFAIEFLRAGGDVFTLQRLLGHNSLEMVKHYLQLAQADVEDAFRKSSPADRMRL
jgi:integrase/recombinase XerD